MSIQEVLSDVNQPFDAAGQLRVFNIDFVKADGSIRKMKCQKAGNTFAIGEKKSRSKSKYAENTLYKLFVEELPGKHFKEINISTIIGFDGQKVWH